jgi:RNA polymerase sigma-70 factor (family 1)
MVEKITVQNFEHLFREYYSRLYFYAFDYVEDIEVSKDIVSDVFTSIWKMRERINYDKATSYLFVSVRNQCVDYIRKQRCQNDYSNFYLNLIEEEEEESFEQIEFRIEEMSKVIDTLPPLTRFVLEECYFHHKKYKEVADDLKMSTNGIKKHIVKAFAKLREHFNVTKADAVHIGG